MRGSSASMRRCRPGDQADQAGQPEDYGLCGSTNAIADFDVQMRRPRDQGLMVVIQLLMLSMRKMVQAANTIVRAMIIGGLLPLSRWRSLSRLIGTPELRAEES